jgi:hypothetical protein
VSAVRRELARLYKEARRGEISAADASRLGSLLALIGRLIEGSDLENRVRALERAQEERHGRPSKSRRPA